MRSRSDTDRQETVDDRDVVVEEVPVETPFVSGKPTRPLYSEVARIDCELADGPQLAEFLELVASLLREDSSLILIVQKKIPRGYVPETPKTQP